MPGLFRECIDQVGPCLLPAALAMQGLWAAVHPITPRGKPAALQACMREASRVVLEGLEFGSEAKIVGWPNRYTDKRGEEMWTTVTRLLEDLENNCDRYIVALSGRLGSPRDRLARSIFPRSGQYLHQ